MPLKGIRLPDLYSSEDYNNWANVSENKALLSKTIEENPFSDPNKIRGHLYLNSKIKDMIGEEEFGKLPHMSLDEKLGWYNSHKAQEEAPSDFKEPNLIQPELIQKDSVTQMAPTNLGEEAFGEDFVVPTGSMRDWFKENASGDYSAYLNAERDRINEQIDATTPKVTPMSIPGVTKDTSYKSGETKQLEDELNTLKETRPTDTATIKLKENQIKLSKERDAQTQKDAFNELYQEEEIRQDITEGNNYFSPINQRDWETSSAEQKVDSLSGRLLSRFDNDPTFAFDTFKRFEDEMNRNVPQYRNYHDTAALGYNPKEMKDIMAEYYAIRELKSPEAAISFAQAVFQNRLAERQSISEKSALALKQFGVNIAGNTAAVVGIVGNTINGVIKASQEGYDIDDVGWWKEFLYYAADNPLTKWGNLALSTGTWSPELQKIYEEAQFNALQLQRKAGNETKFFDINTIFDIFGQSGFTVAAMMTGGVAAQLLSSTIGRGTTALALDLLAKEGAGWGTRLASNAINIIGKGIVLGGSGYLPAAAEASVDSMEVYDTAKNENEESVLMGLKGQLEREYNDGTYDLWYMENSRIPYTLDLENSLSEEDARKLAQLREQEKAYLWDTYQDLRVKEELSDPETQRMIEQSAKRAAARNLFDEASWIALGDLTISNTLGLGVKEAKKMAKRAIIGTDSKFKWVPEGNHYRPVAKAPTTYDKVKAIGKGFVEAGEEGFEEGFQTVDTEMRKDLNKNLIAQYISNKYDPDGAGALTDGMRENWEVAKKSINENLLSDEALYSFALGAVSAGFGSPTIFRGVKTGINTYKNTGSVGKAVGKGLTTSFRNPFVENWQEMNVKYLEDQQEAADLNKWISAHPEIETLNDQTAIIAFMNQQAEALKNGDEATYRDALMGQQVATMLMMDRVNPKGVRSNFYAKIKELSKLSPTDKEAREVLNQALTLRNDTTTPRTIEGPLNEEEAQVIEDVAKRARELNNTYLNLKTAIKALDSQFGESISSEARDALAYGLMMKNNWTERINSIHNDAIKSYNDANPNNKIIPISEEELAIKNAIAKYGSKEGVEKEYKSLLKDRASLRNNRKRMYRYEYKDALNKNAKAIRENREAAKAINSAQDNTLIKAEEILSLSDKQRAYLLDKANINNYSDAQKKEITRFMTSDGIHGDTIENLIDAGKLQNRKEYFEQQYADLMKNNGALIPIFDREVRKKSAKTWVRRKLETAFEANTYEGFKKAMDDSMNTGEFTTSDRMMLSEVFAEDEVKDETRRFYTKYQQEEMDRRAIRGIIENSPEFNNLKGDKKEIVLKASERVQREGKELTAENIINTLVDPEYINQLEREGLDVTPLRETFETVARDIEKLIAQKKIYDENYKTLKEEKERQIKDKKEAAKLKDPSRTPKPEGKEATIINKERYESNKDKYNSIFSKIFYNLSHRKQQPLTVDEYVSLMNLYIDDPVVGDLLIDNFSTSLTEESIRNTIEKLEKAVENKLYTDEKASESTEVKNSLKLAANLQSLLGAIDMFRKSGIDTSVSTYLQNSIIQINPEFKKVLEDGNKPKLSKNATFNGKTEKSLTTNTEKKWYQDNHVEDNLKTVMSIPNSKVTYVLIKDSKLENDLATELNTELNDDNLPIIVAAQVEKNTKNAVEINGNHYIYVGLLRDSRDSNILETRNNYNGIRNISLEQEEDGPIQYNGKTFKFSGNRPKMASTTSNTEETTSFRDWLFDKYKGNKEGALKDFIEHYKILYVTVKDGEARASYEWKGKVRKLSWATEANDTAEDRPRPTPIYIKENSDGTTTPLFLEVSQIDQVQFDEEHTMVEALDELDIADKKYASNDGNYIRKAIISLANYIINLNNSDLFSSRTNFLKALSPSGKSAGLNGDSSNPGIIESKINKYLNLLKTGSYKRGEISIGVEIDAKDNLNLICWETNFDNANNEEGFTTDSDGNKTLVNYGIPRILSSISLATLAGENVGNTAVAINKFVQSGIRNLIFDKEGNIRTADTRNNGTQWPIIKFEDSYSKNDITRERQFSEDDVKLKLYGNIWRAKTQNLNEVPEGVSIEAKAQESQPPAPSTTGNPQQEALKRITQPEYIDTHKGEHFDVGPNETEVTTFIKGGDDEIDWGDTSLAGQLATNLGTSIDKLYRVWRELNSSLTEEERNSFEKIDSEAEREYKHREVIRQKIRQYMRDTGAGSWPGLNPQSDEFLEMLNQLQKIDRFFSKRGEIQVPVDLIFKGGIKANGKIAHFIAKPDIVTVDKNGQYHLYDMKTFRYNAGLAEKAPGFDSLFFTMNGKKDLQKDMDKWRKQLSLYKVLMEEKFGKGSVSDELGIVPIRLGYQVEGSVDTSMKVPGIGAYKINTLSGESMQLSFKEVASEEEPVTRCYDDVIKLQAIEDVTSINPNGWRTMNKVDEAKSNLDEAKTATKLETPPEPVKQTVEVFKPLNETSKDEAMASIGDQELNFDEIDGMLNDIDCNY